MSMKFTQLLVVPLSLALHRGFRESRRDFALSFKYELLLSGSEVRGFLEPGDQKETAEEPAGRTGAWSLVAASRLPGGSSQDTCPQTLAAQTAGDLS